MEDKEERIYLIGGAIVFWGTWLIVTSIKAVDSLSFSFFLGLIIAIVSRYIIWPVFTMLMFAMCAALRHAMGKEE